eukprot:571026-Amphidinium_carterae.1
MGSNPNVHFRRSNLNLSLHLLYSSCFTSDFNLKKTANFKGKLPGLYTGLSGLRTLPIDQTQGQAAPSLTVFLEQPSSV